MFPGRVRLARLGNGGLAGENARRGRQPSDTASPSAATAASSCASER